MTQSAQLRRIEDAARRASERASYRRWVRTGRCGMYVEDGRAGTWSCRSCGASESTPGCLLDEARRELT